LTGISKVQSRYFPATLQGEHVLRLLLSEAIRKHKIRSTIKIIGKKNISKY
jgi:hypothetical protein